jgi:ABC-2 type transport system permease protein
MSIALAVARREIRAYFNSPVAYIVLGVFLLLAGYFFFNAFFVMGIASMRGFFGLTPILLVVFGPALTMRLFAEERKAGTLEFLLTMPVRDGEVVAGKFLAALGILSVGIALTIPYALSVASLTAEGNAFDWGPVIGGYLGLFLMASSFLSLGLWASAMSRNQIVGFIVALLVCFAFYFVDKVAIFMPGSIAPVLEFLSVDTHFSSIARGVIDTRDVIFYLSLTTAGLLLTTRALMGARR